MKLKLFILFFCIALILSRYFNLESTARFVWDESMDLVKIHTLYQHPKLTLIGPIPEDNTKVFSSLTYYLFLPFAALNNFSTISTTYSSAFFGIITVILFNLLLIKLNKANYLLTLLSLIFIPLLISSRWAWNPNFIPFWQVLGFLTLFSSLPLNFIMSGLLFGLTIHQHWYAVFSCVGMIILIIGKYKKTKFTLHFLFGLFISVAPFILFDVTHPPGLFFTRMLYFSPVSPTTIHSFSSAVSVLANLPFQFIGFYFGTNSLFLQFVILSVTIIATHKSTNKILLLPLLFQIVGLTLISGNTFNHYYLPGAVPFLLWLSLNSKKFASKILISCIFVLFVFNFQRIFLLTDWTNNIQAIDRIVEYIAVNKTDKFNILVASSPDPNTKGRRYRDLLLLKNIFPENTDNYNNIKTLFVISYQDSWDMVVKDPAYELDNFRNKIPTDVVHIPKSQWTVYKVSN